MNTPSKKSLDRAARGLPEPQRCRAHKKDGTRCRRWPVKGATVCPKHGGAAPQVRRKAMERLEAATDTLMTALLKIAASAESEAVRLAAVKDALDRAGFSPAQVHKVALQQPWDDLLQDLVTDESLFIEVDERIPIPRRAALSPGLDLGGVGIDAEDDDEWPPPGLHPTVRSHVVSGGDERSPFGGESHRDIATEMSERTSQRRTPDPTRPPEYVREAMEADGLDWREPRPASRGTRWTG